MAEKQDTWQTLIKEREFNDILIGWNSKINLVSRRKKDVSDLIDDSKLFFEAIEFKEDTQILDLGTGGGFPGIVLAINYPQAKLTLVDSIKKKTSVVEDVVKRLGLSNVEVICSRAEELKMVHKFDYVVARSVATLQDLVKWSRNLLKAHGKLVTVKGGEISGEINKTRRMEYVKRVDVYERGERLIVVCELYNA